MNYTGLDRIRHLATEEELKELEAVFGSLAPRKALSNDSKVIPKGMVKLKRTFNMTMDGITLRFWRVIGPETHPNYHSDLSLAGLKEWRII